jgi:hypothetical protein
MGGYRFGILALNVGDAGFSWEFKTTWGSVMDSGSRECR